MNELTPEGKDLNQSSAETTTRKPKSFFSDNSYMYSRKKKSLSKIGEGAVKLAAWGCYPVPLHGTIPAEGVQNPRPGHPEDWQCTCDPWRRKQAHKLGLDFKPCPLNLRGKKPWGNDWAKMSLNSADKAREIWTERKNRDSNVGIITGSRTGLMGLDVDGERGARSLAALEEKFGPLPKTVTVVTGSGGRHFWFRIPPGVTVKNSAKKLGWSIVGEEITDLDTRGDGGQLVGPPSRHPTGVEYSYLDGCSPDDIPFDQLPFMLPWLVQLCEDAKAENIKKMKATAAPAKAVNGQAEGGAADPFAKAGTALAAGAGGGFEGFLAQIGDGEGQGGFNSPIWSSILSYHGTHGPDADPEPLLDRLRSTIAAAPRKPDRGTMTKYDTDDYLLEQIENARVQIRKNPPSRGLPENVYRTAAEGIVALNKVLAIVYPGGKTRFATYDRGVLKLMSRSDAEARYANWRYIDPEDKDGKRLLPLFKAWLSSSDRREYADIGFEPGVDDPELLNLWTGFAVAPNPYGAWTRLKRHLFDVVCNRNVSHFIWLVSWLAQMVQQPRKKMGTAVVLRGALGIGKTIVCDYLKIALGRHFMKVAREEHLLGKFNEHLAQALLVLAEEAIWGKQKKLEGVLKDMITADEIIFEKKYNDAILVKNYSRYIFLSNEDSVVPATPGERRYFVLDVPDFRKGDFAYFDAIVKEMENGGPAAMLHDLMRFDYSTVNLRQPPMTRALQNQILENLGQKERWLRHILVDGGFTDEGSILSECEGWADNAVEIPRKAVADSYDRYVSEFRQGNRHAMESEIGAFLKKVLGVETVQRRKGNMRDRYYVFDALPELRAKFEKLFNVPCNEPVGLEGLNADREMLAQLREAAGPALSFADVETRENQLGGAGEWSLLDDDLKLALYDYLLYRAAFAIDADAIPASEIEQLTGP